jgi:hypothetical protein
MHALHSSENLFPKVIKYVQHTHKETMLLEQIHNIITSLSTLVQVVMY